MLDEAPPRARHGLLGRYELIRRLAVGGMAEIYLARATGPASAGGFEKVVVLKRMLPQHAGDGELLRMFLDEARLMATLNHPNITQVYDVGMAGESTFFTMEHVHGEDLRTVLDVAGRVRAGATPSLGLPDALGIVAAAAAGLHYAHEKRGADGRALDIVHRDLSPSNVLLSYDGGVKVTDFGVAKWAFQKSETRHGTLKGKLGYMSPEQCRAEPLDRRSDVFALGILLYETTTGVRPFRGDGDYEILDRIVNHDVAPPCAVSPGYPPELERIVLRALERDRDRRFPTAQELQLELEALARHDRLAVSAVALAKTMESLFGGKVEAWREARQADEHSRQPLAEVERVLPPTVTDLHARRSVHATDAEASAGAGKRLPLVLVSAAVIIIAAVAAFGARTGGNPPAAPVPATGAPSLVPAPPAGPPAGAGRAVPGSTRLAAPRNVGSERPKRLDKALKRDQRSGPSPPSSVKVWDPDSPVPP